MSRATLDQALLAQVEYELAHAARETVVHVLAVLGFVVWGLTLWPTTLPGQARTLGLAAFALCALVAIGAFARERAWLHERDRRLRELTPPGAP